MKLPGCILIFACCLAGGAHAAAYKCKDAAGKVTYSDSPCADLKQKGDKLFDRGAGYNPLNEEEKRSFIEAVTRNCLSRRSQTSVGAAQWRSYCECSAAESAKTVSIEELRSVMSNPKNKAMAGRMTELGQEAGKACASHLTNPPAPAPRKTQA
ncbi:MAG: DUF4124 domain-containing protein [Burkholderiales bacterium]